MKTRKKHNKKIKIKHNMPISKHIPFLRRDEEMWNPLTTGNSE